MDEFVVVPGMFIGGYLLAVYDFQYPVPVSFRRCRPYSSVRYDEDYEGYKQRFRVLPEKFCYWVFVCVVAQCYRYAGVYGRDNDYFKYVPQKILPQREWFPAVFPVSKSTHVLYVAGTQFDRFAKDMDVSYDDLSTWDGFFSVAEKYYTWSGGKPFCALDYPIRCVELNALSKGAENFYTEDGWYDFDNPVFKESWMEFAQAISKGHIVVSDLYSNTMVMTGEVIAGIGSSASILYYNDVITYPDNTTEPMNLQVVPLPKTKDADLLVTLAGVGLCSYKTTEQKAEAAAVFARYITEEARNFEFVASTGYMPVNKGSFEKIKDYAFESKAYENLYTTLFEVNETATAIREPSFAGYYEKIYALYDRLREMQPQLTERFANGEDAAKLAEETWELFRSIE